MSVIRRIAPRVCPACEAEGTLFVNTDRQLTCRLCGYREGVTDPEVDPGSPVTVPEDLEARRSSYPVTWGTEYKGPIDPWARAAYESGLQYANQGNWQKSIRAFERALEQDRDFIDAHLWIARLAESDERRRDHYENVLALMPNHLEAMRELMVLNGHLSDAEGARAANAAVSPAVVAPDTPVEASSVEIVCDVCGSNDIQVEGDQAMCRTCGNQQTVTPLQEGYGLKSLAMSMLKKRGQAIEWSVGEHILMCKKCGAERIIPRKLTSRCPFCGSNNVIQTDAFKSFQQPDGVIPFRVHREDAQTYLDDALNSRVERLKGFFINNRVKRIYLMPTYIPLWLFDAVLEVIRTVRDNRGGYSNFSTPQANMARNYQREQLTEMAHDKPAVAVKSPPRHLMERIERYNWKRIVPYTPSLISEYQAEIYTIDFDDASLIARERIADDMRFKYGHTGMADSSYSVQIQSMFRQLSFRLVLVPVWVATILEADGDLRTGLINGQTGKTVLGKAHKLPD